MIEPATGNLLTARADALVNTVNCEGVMGKGIALQFKQAWPAMFKAYAAACKAGAVVPGRMHVWETNLLPGADRIVGHSGPRFIINFPTKRHWRAGSRLEDIDAGLVDLVAQIRALGVRSIAVPPLGAGNGGLDWAVVRPRVVAALEAVPDVQVLLFEPMGAPPAAEQPVGTERPPLTTSRALFLKLMALYRIPDYPLRLIEVQKLAYFLQFAGQPLRLEFKAHHYGPYADSLNHVLHRLEGHYLRGATDRKPDTEVVLLEGAEREADQVLATDDDARSRLQRVASLIEGFETPYSMELLATVHWVARHDQEAAVDAEVCVRGVHAWSDRKRKLLEPAHIRVAWEHLRRLGWMPATDAAPA
jgi:O-acetyl-ADP-ribose deacetylase (regulator of RNase III)